MLSNQPAAGVPEPTGGGRAVWPVTSWFGDLVTQQWWGDLWLSESFADFCEYQAM